MNIKNNLRKINEFDKDTKNKKSYYCDYTYDMLLYLYMHVFSLLYLETSVI